MTAPQAVHDLVERFRRNADSYRSGRYNETQVRREFVDPLFKALGWDIDNEQGYAEVYKDVIHEDAVKVGGATKAPDYSFRVGGTRKFFLETKKPSVDLKHDAAPAFQLRRYAWSAKLPLSVLTDFEELAVYDCRKRPVKTDRASTARIKYITFDQYVERWDEIAEVFSRDAVLKGSFDRYAESAKKQRGTAEVDDAFLHDIEHWRDLLARNLALRNDLTQRELNWSVQKTIDRIIFLRIAEDRGIEEYGHLRQLQNGGNVYRRMQTLFRQADERYNSGLFHFSEERGRPEDPDELTPSLELDDRVLKEILKGLYYPDSPYEFYVLPADILGQVYEQFLGRVIRLTPSGRAVVEEKPEVRKAGGVYYTPTYIVDYIVRETVGPLVEGRKPGPRGGVSKLRILDPACGSGSFLLGAYQYLLDWHLEQYEADRARYGTYLYQGVGGEWRLTTEERKRILLNNIHGVDIDAQAVEVTKLSLLLKVLEGENQETLTKQFQLFRERALPDLGANIKCGNSLIGPDFYDGEQLGFLDDEERYRINAFDWEDEFPEIMGDGGFDAVIGNPPYIRIQALKEWAPVEVEHYKKRYRSAGKGNYDIYVVFAEKGLELLSERGRLGYILPSKFFATDYGRRLRGLLSEQKAVRRVVDFRHEQVFRGATTYTCLLFLSSMPNNIATHATAVPPTVVADGPMPERSVASGSLTEEPWNFASDRVRQVLLKSSENSAPLLALPTRIARGSSTGADPVFMLRTRGTGFETRNGDPVEVEDDILRIPLYATDFGRYSFSPAADERVIFPYEVSEGGYSLLSEESLRVRYPKAHAYLGDRKRELERRKQYRAWFSFSAPRNLDVHDAAQAVVPLLAEKGSYAVLPSDMSRYCLMASGGFSLSVSNGSAFDPLYVLGLLNSTLLFWLLRSRSNVFRGGWITCTKQYVGTLPIRTIDFSDPGDVSRHDQVVSIVERMLDLNTRLAEARTGNERTRLQREIDGTDRRIDRLVYELYGLTDEEVAIVERTAT